MTHSLMILIGVFILLGILSFIVRNAFKFIIYISLVAFAVFYFATGGDFNKAFNQTLQFEKIGGQYVVNTANNYIKKNIKVSIENSNMGAAAKIEYGNYTIKNVIGTKEYDLYKGGQLMKTIKLDQVITIDKNSESINLPDILIELIDKQ